MTMPILATAPSLSWQDYGLLGLVVGFALTTTAGLVWWVVRGMRSDMRRTLTLAEESNTRFLAYVIETAAKQSSAVVAATMAIEAMNRQFEGMEQRANQRHAAVMGAIAKRAARAEP